MKRLILIASIAFALAPTAGLAQSHSPYAGFETRAIKALSDQQIGDLRAGLGLSLALAAELNGYPGPRHTLELAGALSLSDAQRAAVEKLYADMKTESVPIGERLIAQEADLDRQFADKTVTPASLGASTQAIGRTQALLRETHLKYHLLTLAVLTPEQAQRYAQLRGYGREHDPGLHKTPSGSN
jgi:Spy/CpxP family protein refolding chaperone